MRRQGYMKKMQGCSTLNKLQANVGAQLATQLATCSVIRGRAGDTASDRHLDNPRGNLNEQT